MPDQKMILAYHDIKEALTYIGEFLIHAKGKTEEAQNTIDSVKDFHTILDQAWYRAKDDVWEIAQG